MKRIDPITRAWTAWLALSETERSVPPTGGGRADALAGTGIARNAALEMDGPKQ